MNPQNASSAGTDVTRRAIVGVTTPRLDTVAWGFLGSEFADQSYADWPIDRRVDAYLRRQQMPHLVDDGTMRTRVLESVMANLGRAMRDGLLEAPHLVRHDNLPA